MADHHETANFIGSIADLLRGPYRPPQYERVMQPMTVLRRFDCVLAPHPMAKRTAAPAPREGITDDRIQELEERMQRLQETMDVLIGSIDEFREDLVHTLRNLPDQLPPPVHIHSLPLDPTAPDFGERINVIPQEVPTTTQCRGATPIRLAASKKTCGSGFARRTSVMVTTPSKHERGCCNGEPK